MKWQDNGDVKSWRKEVRFY